MKVNNKIKKNLTLIVSLAATGVVAVGLLIYVLILFFNWSEFRDRTEAARNEVKSLVSQKPAPGKENEERIQKDIALYEAKSQDMVDTFKSPLRPAVDAFLKELPPPKISALTDEEKEFYKKEGTGIEGDEETKAVPLAIRKLSYNDFRKFFNDRFELFCQQRNISEDKDRFSLMTLSLFRSECINLFPQGSWKKAMDRFVEVAKPLVYETINEADPLPLLLVGFGMPRRVSDNIVLLERQIDTSIARKIVPMAAESNLVLGEDALKFIGGSSETKGLAVKDYPMAFFHWDVFGDIVRRLGKAKVASLQKVVLRAGAAEDSGEEGGSRSSAINLENSFEQDENFKLYHYTVVFTGNMTAVRAALREFDLAWKERRMYIVRGISLFAGDNGAAEVMKQLDSNQKDKNTENSPRNSRRRRRRSEELEDASQTGTVKLSEKELRESHYRVILKRKQKEAANSTGESKKAADELLNDKEVNEYLSLRQSADQGSHSADEENEFFAKLEKKLAPHERFGYGRILVGGEENRNSLVYLDVDYVVFEQNQ